jgi:hypothetical protein
MLKRSLSGWIDAELNSRGIDPDRAVPGSRRLKHMGVTVFILEKRKQERPLEARDCSGDVSRMRLRFVRGGPLRSTAK